MTVAEPTTAIRDRPGAEPLTGMEVGVCATTRSAGRMRIGVAVTEMLRRHPVMVAQAALTLSELTKRPLILGVGAGERLNTWAAAISKST